MSYIHDRVQRKVRKILQTPSVHNCYRIQSHREQSGCGSTPSRSIFARETRTLRHKLRETICKLKTAPQSEPCLRLCAARSGEIRRLNARTGRSRIIATHSPLCKSIYRPIPPHLPLVLAQRFRRKTTLDCGKVCPEKRSVCRPARLLVSPTRSHSVSINDEV